MPPSLSAGQTVLITRAASVQFMDPFHFRIINVDDRPTCDGWAWLRGYQLDSAGDAVECREIFVQLAGLAAASSRSDRGDGGQP